MVVYHYTKKKYAISNIVNSRMKVSRINGLNDPYELYLNMYRSGKLLSELEVINIKNNFNERMGFISFSRNFNNPVQWGHYADKFFGVCIAYEIPKKYLIKIRYMRKPLAVDFNRTDFEQAFVEATKSKYVDWNYEKEMRLVVNFASEDLILDEGMHFVVNREALIPKSIYLGLKCSLSEDDMVLLRGRGINVFNTKLSSDRYKILVSDQVI